MTIFFQMQLLFTNKISHHDYLFHYFVDVNIQALSFSKENGAMKITFTRSSPWIILLNFKCLNCTLEVKGNESIEG